MFQSSGKIIRQFIEPCGIDEFDIQQVPHVDFVIQTVPSQLHLYQRAQGKDAIAADQLPNLQIQSQLLDLPIQARKAQAQSLRRLAFVRPLPQHAERSSSSSG